jgi:hypothetical protein
MKTGGSISLGPESSTLFALTHLKQLEAERVATVEAEIRERAQTQRLQRESAERDARERAELAERLRAEQDERARIERERTELEARARVERAAALAREEQEARLRAEQRRIDAQLEHEERRARSPWPMVAVSTLVLGLASIAGLAWDGRERAQLLHEAADSDRTEHERRMAEIDARLAELAADGERIDARELALAASEAEREELLAEKAALEEELAKTLEALAAGTKPAKVKKKRSTERPRTTPAPEGRREGDRIELDDSLDPLGGLPGHG